VAELDAQLQVELDRLLQACGFDLSLALVPFERNLERDARIQEVSRLTPQERLRAMVDRLGDK
jgi:hypothetical protein